MKTKNKIFIFATIGFAFLFTFTYFGFLEFQKEIAKNDFETEHTTYIYMSGNFLYPNITIKGDILNASKELNFTEKEKFVYSVIWIKLNSNDTLGMFKDILIGKYIGIGKTESKRIVEIEEKNNEIKVTKWRMDKDNKEYLSETLWINKKGIIVNTSNNDIFGKKLSQEELNIRSNMLQIVEDYGQWMSALSNNFSWTYVVERNMRLNTSQIESYNNLTHNITYIYCSDDKIITKYKVVGIEKVNGRKCFKVHVTTSYEDNKGCNDVKNYIQSSWKLENISYAGGILEGGFRWNISGTLWVDYDKRILVKAIVFDNGKKEFNEWNLQFL